MLNILTVDLEDYFMVSAFEDAVRREDWEYYESRIERNTYRLLDTLSSVRSPRRSIAQHGSAATLKNSSGPGSQKLNLSPSTTRDDSISSPSSMPPAPCDSVKATFFCIGWVAERYPRLIREIHEVGHEIACHSYDHRIIYRMTPDKFREDVRKSKRILEDLTGEEVIGYRAPSYSITNKSRWAFEVLIEEGFQYDSSIFPIHHDFYGMPNAPRFPFVVSLDENSNLEFSMLEFEFPSASFHNTRTAAPLEDMTSSGRLRTRCDLLEFPISTVKVFGQNLPIGGGGYFRLFPYSLVRKGLESINQRESKPFIFYVHPWEFDPEQPRINSVSLRSKLRHYANLDKTGHKFKRLVSDFQFLSIKQFLKISGGAAQQQDRGRLLGQHTNMVK